MKKIVGIIETNNSTIENLNDAYCFNRWFKCKYLE